MKKLIAIFLILFTLLLTACNNQTVETSTSTNKTEQTESTSVLQTTESTQTSGTTSATQESLSSETTTEKTEIPEGYTVPEELKDEIVGYGLNSSYIELPSRILFTQSLQKGYWSGEWYQMSNDYLVYYNKADGETYVNCFDPLCDHTECAVQNGFGIEDTLFINDRFYYVSYRAQIYSYAFDGSDVQLELDLFDEMGSSWRNKISYENYIYIMYLTADEEYHLLRYDTKAKKIEDLTAKTGNFILPYFFYNGEIYGCDSDGIYIKTDLGLSYTKEIDPFFARASYEIAQNSYLIGLTRDKEGKDNDGFSSYIGIQTYDMKTGTETLISNEMIGKEVSSLLFADENYYYFLADDQIYIGKSRSNHDMYNNYGGKIYRVNRDGTNCICIYDNKGMTFNSMIIYEDTVIVSASEIGVHGGIAQTWANGMYIGTINEDGTIDSLEWVEVIA